MQLDLRVISAFDGLPDGAVVQAPALHTLSQWAAELSSRASLLGGRASPLAPDSYQVQELWLAAVASGRPYLGAAERFALASLARNARRLLNQWIPGDGQGREATADRDFQNWSKQVHAAMQASNWVAPEDWVERLAGQLRRGEVTRELLPEDIRLSGFVELTALESTLLEALEGAGVNVEAVPRPSAQAAKRSRQGYGSFASEIAAAARWAEAELAAGRERIGIVVNGLQAVAGEVRRIFENHFQPRETLAGGDPRRAPFRMSCGEPLGSQPLIADALLLLRLAEEGPGRRQDFPRVSRLLLSPNWAGGISERFARAMLEQELRATGRYQWTLARLGERAAQSSAPQALSELIERINAVPARVAAGHPARQLLERLLAWGWPGEPPCQGAEREALMQFLTLLERLDRHATATTRQCLDRLEYMCREETAPRQGGAFSPIQVLTPEESYGLYFESAWIANLTAENWPPRPIGNPLLGGTLLRQVPRADHDGMLAYAERLTDALKNCADRVHFSWCDRLDDLQVSPSPLIEDVPAAGNGIDAPCTLQRAVAPKAGELSGYRDHPWLVAAQVTTPDPLPKSDQQRLRSAVKTLNYQSACPLAGYLFGRLDAVFEDVPEPFIDDLSRGALVHRALEYLYRPCVGSEPCPDSATVPDVTAGALQDSHAELWLLPAEFEALRGNIEELLERWLEFARDRVRGRVELLEWREEFDFAGFGITVRIDRADRQSDGRLFLLDYKTGAPKRRTWAGERITDVQLPLYAVLLSKQVDAQPCGVATAHLRLGEMSMHGLTGHAECTGKGVDGFDKPRGLAKAFANWDDALESWGQALEALITEFRAGDGRAQFYDRDALAHAGLEIALRQQETEEWRRANGR